MKIKPLIITLIVLCGIIVAFLALKTERSPRMATIGSPVPNFNLLDMNKNKISLSDMKGSVVFVNFWATWCGSCVEELPSVERLSGVFSGNPQFKMVTILYKDDDQRASGFMKENGLTFPVYLNSDGSAAKIFAITGVPETYIIDKKGILRDKVIGPAEWDSPQAISAFRDLIKEP